VPDISQEQLIFRLIEAALELKTSVINEVFNINRIVLYAKEVFIDYPSVQ